MKKGLRDILKKDKSDNLFWKGYHNKILYAECDDDTLKEGNTFSLEYGSFLASTQAVVFYSQSGRKSEGPGINCMHIHSITLFNVIYYTF